MFEVDRIEEWRGQEVLDRSGAKVGKLDEVFHDKGSGEPMLASVKTGRISSHTQLVPLAGSTFGRNHVQLPYEKDQVASAPELSGGTITRQDELLLARHYGVTPPDSDESDDAVRYESASVVAERRASAEAAMAKAEQLEAQAERKGTEAQESQARASDADQRAEAADIERQRLLDEAASLRAEADGAQA